MRRAVRSGRIAQPLGGDLFDALFQPGTDAGQPHQAGHLRPRSQHHGGESRHRQRLRHVQRDIDGHAVRRRGGRIGAPGARNATLLPLSPAQVRQNLESTAQDRGPAGKDNDWGAGLIDGYAFVAKTKGISGYAPTAFPAYQRVSASVANYGLWTYPFAIGQADLGIPIGATITINGQAKCTCCFSASACPHSGTPTSRQD